jgi:hypothetical protein
VVKATVEECSARARSWRGERGRSGGEGLVRRGGVEVPFYRVGVEWDGQTGRGIERLDSVAMVVAEWHHHSAVSDMNEGGG